MSHDAIDWRPTATLDVLKQRAQMLTDARAFFARLNVLEVETPALTTSGVTDPNIASIECRLAARPLPRQTRPQPRALRQARPRGCPLEPTTGDSRRHQSQPAGPLAQYSAVTGRKGEGVYNA